MIKKLFYIALASQAGASFNLTIMKKIILLALAVTLSASFNLANAADKKKKKKDKTQQVVEEQNEPVTLTTASDSISFSAGMVRTEGLMPFLQQSYNVDSTQIDDFINGFETAMKNGINDKMKAYCAGQQIAIMVNQRMVPFLKDEFKSRKDSINEVLFNKGFVSSLLKDYSLMSDSTAKAYFDAAFKQAVNERNEATRKEGENFLAENKTKEGVITTPSGLQYKIIEKGTGDIPTASDEVTVKYEGKLIDGTVFDSSYKRKDGTAKFRANQVIKGWTEALTMMPVGSKWELYIPQELAYGERQAGKIKPYSALIFTVELVSFDKPKETPKKPVTNTSKENSGKTTTKAGSTKTKVLKSKK